MTESGADGKGGTSGERHAEKRARADVSSAHNLFVLSHPCNPSSYRLQQWATGRRWSRVIGGGPTQRRRRITEPTDVVAKHTSKTLSISTHQNSDLIAGFDIGTAWDNNNQT